MGVLQQFMKQLACFSRYRNNTCASGNSEANSVLQKVRRQQEYFISFGSNKCVPTGDNMGATCTNSGITGITRKFFRYI